MKSFFKTLGLGVLYTITLPITIVFLALYAVYCLFAFIYISIRSIITFFKGGTPLGDLPEDVEAKRILLKRKQDAENLAAASAAALNMMNQQAQFYAAQQPQQFQQPSPQSFPNVMAQNNFQQNIAQNPQPKEEDVFSFDEVYNGEIEDNNVEEGGTSYDDINQNE